MGSYYGPEFAPTVLILAVFPVLIASLALLARWVDTAGCKFVKICATPGWRNSSVSYSRQYEGRLRFDEEVETNRLYYVVAMLGTLGILLGSQIVLIIINL
ncbi:hypothetical protein [Halobacteriaceae bacterium SHR40]|uniref:hypothetical protein n=1 Tax=Halovenus amylolytica TaxID=2500550 RepID=UPI000FE4314A